MSEYKSYPPFEYRFLADSTGGHPLLMHGACGPMTCTVNAISLPAGSLAAALDPLYALCTCTRGRRRDEQAPAVVDVLPRMHGCCAGHSRSAPSSACRACRLPLRPDTPSPSPPIKPTQVLPMCGGMDLGGRRDACDRTFNVSSCACGGCEGARNRLWHCALVG
jgi:hypothetical protein